MSVDLTISISEHRNGVNSTYRLDFQKKVNLSMGSIVPYTIDRLKREFTSFGYKRITAGKTLLRSKRDG